MNSAKILILLILSSCFLITGIRAQNDTVKTYSYNSNPLDCSALEVFSSILEEKNFIFTSELHYHPYSLKVRKKFILFLASKEMLDKIGLEADYAYGYEVKHFFKTGDTLRFKKLFSLHPEMTAYTESADFYKYYSHLKHLTDSLNLHLDFYGIDLVLFNRYKGSIFSVNNILKNCQNSIIQNAIKFGNGLIDKKIGRSRAAKWLDIVKFAIESQKTALEQCVLPTELKDLSNILFNIDQSIKYQNESGLVREEQIAVNFMKYFKPTDYVYAQFGYPHIFRNSIIKYDNGQTFIDNLNEVDFYKNKSIIIQFMPWGGTELYFPLFSDDEMNTIRPMINHKKLPQLVDFRKMKSIKKCFDFAIIVPGGWLLK